MRQRRRPLSGEGPPPKPHHGAPVAIRAAFHTQPGRRLRAREHRRIKTRRAGGRSGFESLNTTGRSHTYSMGEFPWAVRSAKPFIGCRALPSIARRLSHAVADSHPETAIEAAPPPPLA